MSLGKFISPRPRRTVRRSLMTVVSKLAKEPTKVKAAPILTAAVLIGAGTLAITHGNIAHSAGPVTLQCDVADTTKYYGNYRRPDNEPETKHSVWIISLVGNAWNLISIDGHVLLDDPSLDADGRARIAKGLPLRTTETSYFLQDKSRTQINAEVSSYQNELVIERVTGTLSGSSGSIYSKKPGAAYDSSGSIATETTGHCAPVSITAKF